MRAIALPLLCAVFSTASCRRAATAELLPPAERAAIEQAVLACHDQCLAAADALDVDRLGRFVAETDRGSMIGNGRLLRTREEVIAGNRRQFQGIAALKYEPRERLVTALSRTAALLVTTGQTRLTTGDGREIVTPYAQTIVLVLREGRWQVLHLHSSAPR
jgi:SnoaL-like domain